MKITTMSRSTRISIRGYKGGNMNKKTIKFLDKKRNEREYPEVEFTDKEIIKYMKEAVNKINKDMITVEVLKKAIKLLREYRVPEPYYVEVENPIESGDPLSYSLTESPFYRDSVGTEELDEAN